MRRLAAALLPLALGALALAGCAPADDGAWQGYVEGSYLRIGPEDPGRLAEVAVARGGRVAAGDLLFRLDGAAEETAVAARQADLAAAEARLADLRAGSRPEEVAVVAAERDAAEATRDAAQKDYDRLVALRRTNVVPQADVDAAEGRLDTARAQLAAAERQLEVARLPPRPDAVRAAEAAVDAARAALAAAGQALARRTVAAPTAGTIEETYFDAGETVAGGAPVVSLLPDTDGRTVRFYVGETERAALSVGGRVAVTCDGCAPFAAAVTFIAAEAEFTPPVIYSRESRGKLVFRVEARPEGGAAPPVGQPVEVRPAGGGP